MLRGGVVGSVGMAIVATVTCAGTPDAPRPAVNAAAAISATQIGREVRRWVARGSGRKVPCSHANGHGVRAGELRDERGGVRCFFEKPLGQDVIATPIIIDII